MPIEAGSLHYAVGPVIAFVVLVLMGFFMRWAFGSGGTSRRTRPGAADEGLLTKVATVSSPRTAQALRAALSDAGIRSTLRIAGAHRAEVLVFPEDAARARELAVSFDPGP